MEIVSQDTINEVTNNFNQIKIQFERISGIIEDISNCKSEYTKTILISAISKISEQIGIKEKIFV